MTQRRLAQAVELPTFSKVRAGLSFPQLWRRHGAIMRLPAIAATSLAIILAFGSWGIAQDEKPPDYSKKFLDEWIEILKDKNDVLGHIEARKALGPDGPYAKAAIPALIDALKDLEWLYSFKIAETLADYGPAAVPSLL